MEELIVFVVNSHPIYDKKDQIYKDRSGVVENMEGNSYTTWKRRLSGHDTRSIAQEIFFFLKTLT